MINAQLVGKKGFYKNLSNTVFTYTIQKLFKKVSKTKDNLIDVSVNINMIEYWD